VVFFFFQAEDGIRDLVRSRGLGDVYKRQSKDSVVLKSKLQKDICTQLQDGRKRPPSATACRTPS